MFNSSNVPSSSRRIAREGCTCRDCVEVGRTSGDARECDVNDVSDGEREIRRGARCEVCSAPTRAFGQKRGAWRPKQYEFRKCDSCHFIYVENPSVDFENLYGRDYYSGKGVDPLVDYVDELRLAKPIRLDEWDGIARTVATVKQLGAGLRWLDYGCGAGGLVRYLNAKGYASAEGYERADVEGASDEHVKTVDEAELLERVAYYDVVTAIEVFEHVLDPASILRKIAAVMKPGAILFYTTGNSAMFERDFFNWAYVMPEIHISYYDPTTMGVLFEKAGLGPRMLPWNSGMANIIRFKVLKSFKIKEASPLRRALPWFALSRIVERKYGVFAFPIGVRSSV
jgi:2-polyprenyl-3-methyl-5-hydroxy-6-metoxy-1,4-benzoquinol methylase